MKDKKLKSEVHAAVREYLNDLIQERKQPGKGGMAVTTHDLLVAAKQAGQKLERGDANGYMMSYVQKVRPNYTCINSTSQQEQQKLQPQQQQALVAPKFPNASNNIKPSNDLVKSGLELLETSRTNDVPSKSHAFRSNVNGHGGKNSKKKSIYDYHWLVWKTGRTPTPAPGAGNFTPTPPTPRPPSRCYTPVIEEDVDLPVHLMGADRPPSAEAGWNKPLIRSPTPAMLRNGTPSEMKPDHRNNMTTPQAILTDNADYQNANTAYKPALQNWISNATDYERDVAYNLFQALNHGSYTGPSNRRGRPKTATGAGAFKPAPPPRYHPRPITAGIRTSVPHYKSFKHPHEEEQYLNIVAKSLGSQNPTQFKYTAANTTTRPRATHLPRAPQTEDLNNTGSFFMNAKLPYKSHYTIHPDWSSEQKNVATKNVKLAKGNGGIKYGWK